MSFVLNHSKDAVDVMNPQERLDLLQYLTPKLVIVPSASGSDSAGDIGNAPTAMQVLTEMRSSREKFRGVGEDSDTNWKRLQELGREMDQQRNGGESLMQILTEMRG